ncbi:carbohydrate kinase family protein [Spirulina subsalsa]|uniref:carbohydrate kinase family protein n=1 Tax=Spirulina subsalsa TaxID=54311 RepID=UPI00036ECCE1|nr:carbohydrate kinase [Spirulina subsalsa]
MSNPRVICLGEILVDYLADQVGVSAEGVESWTRFLGGAPGNVACGLVKLGTPAALVGCVGRDEGGDLWRVLCEEVGVDSRGIQVHPSAPTRSVYVLRSPSGEREFIGFGGQPPDAFADAYLEANLLPTVLFAEAEYLVLGTLELAYPQTRSAIFHALELANEYHLKVFLDINWRPMFWLEPDSARARIAQLWNWVDFVKLSQEEAQWLFNTVDAGAIAHQLNSVEGVVVTGGGSDPIRYCLNDHEGSLTPFQVAVEDTTGAGDGFVAGLLHQLVQQGLKALNRPESVGEIITYAAAVGALVTTQRGALSGQPTDQQVGEFLRR